MNNAFQTRTSLYATPHFFPSLAIFPLIAIFGHMGNNIFILLSGYFLFGKNINFTSQTKKILAQIAFATLTLIFISFIMLELAVHGAFPWWTPKNIQITQFDFFNNSGWFLGYYLFIILFAKLFLNEKLKNMQKKTWHFVLSIELAIICIGSLYGFLDSFVKGDPLLSPSTFVLGIFLHILGSYIRKYNPFERIKTWALWASAIILAILPIWSFYENTKLAILQYTPGTVFQQSHLIDVNPYMGNIVILLLSVIIFELFRRIRPFVSETINYVASATLMIFLVHKSEVVLSTAKGNHSWEKLLMYHPKQFILNVLFLTLVYFATGFVVYVFYDQFTRKLWPKISRLILKQKAATSISKIK